jgi:hypothetical protein
VGLVPINFFYESLSLFYPQGTGIGREEVDILQRLANDQYLARTLKDGIAALDMMLTPLEQHVYRDRLGCWKDVIDHDHRAQIRDMIFMRPFGYLLGQGLAQQYGFSSEMLDVTSDPLVAGFFATHKSPSFRETMDEGLGVIYRFRRPQHTFDELDIGEYNFYTCPSLLDFEQLFARFSTSRDDGLVRGEVESFLVASFREKRQWRCWESFRVSNTLLSATRIRRQAALLLIPDAIYIEKSKNVRTLMAIEDCATRDGTMAFYFRHEQCSTARSDITREYLWPNEQDAFFEMIGNALLLSVVLENEQILPNRIDLLDPGYSL